MPVCASGEGKEEFTGPGNLGLRNLGSGCEDSFCVLGGSSCLLPNGSHKVAYSCVLACASHLTLVYRQLCASGGWKIYLAKSCRAGAAHYY